MSEKSYARQRVSLGRAGALAYRDGAETRPIGESSATRDKTVTTVFELKNSTVTVQESPNGPIGRVERASNVEWTSPMAPATVAALAEVANR